MLHEHVSSPLARPLRAPHRIRTTIARRPALPVTHTSLPTGAARLELRADAREFANRFLQSRGKHLVVTAPRTRPWDWRLEIASLTTRDDAWKVRARRLRAHGQTFDSIAERLGRSASSVRTHARIITAVCMCTRARACTVHGGNYPAAPRELELVRDKAAKLSGAARGYELSKGEQWLRKHDAAYDEFANERHVTTDDMLAQVLDRTNRTHDSLAGMRCLSERKGHYRKAADIDDDWQPRRGTIGTWSWRPDKETLAAIERGDKKFARLRRSYKSEPRPRLATLEDSAAIHWALARIARREQVIADGLGIGTVVLRAAAVLTMLDRKMKHRDYAGKSWYWGAGR